MVIPTRARHDAHRACASPIHAHCRARPRLDGCTRLFTAAVCHARPVYKDFVESFNESDRPVSTQSTVRSHSL